jgi:hypothetical protein
MRTKDSVSPVLEAPHANANQEITDDHTGVGRQDYWTA